MKKYRNVEIYLFNDVLFRYNSFLYLFIHLFKHLFILVFIYLYIYFSIYLFIPRFIYAFIYTADILSPPYTWALLNQDNNFKNSCCIFCFIPPNWLNPDARSVARHFNLHAAASPASMETVK